MAKLSIIIPVLNERDHIASALQALTPLRARGAELIVVDGGSTDGTVARATPLATFVIASPRGRAVQMNAGATIASADVLLFLHADTRLPPDADQSLLDGLARSGRAWGRFDVTIEGRHPLLRVVAWSMNLRSRLTGIATGDQAIFVRREAFRGFPELPLMEDIAFSTAMKRRGRPACLREKVVTSGRRWEARGPLRTIVRMWCLRFLYAMGAAPERLAKLYEK